MVAMDLDLLERVLSECKSDCCRISEASDLCQLDMNLMSIKSCALHGQNVIAGHIQDYDDTISSTVVQNLLDLHNCLDQLCIDYETKLLRQMFMIESPVQRGRPKKIINLAMVGID